MCGTVLSSCDRVARRAKSTWAWQCYWCWGLIRNGEAYHEQKIADDGTVSTVRGHRECVDAHDRERAESRKNGWWYDDCEPIMEEMIRGMTHQETQAERQRRSPHSWAC